MRTLHRIQYEDLVRRELRDDLGRAGDLTTDTLVAPDRQAAAEIVARREGRVCGLEIALTAFDLLGGVVCTESLADGDDVTPGAVLARLEGSARSLLAAERTALNLLAHLSGVATATRDLSRAIAEYPAAVVGTRKTTPGLRSLEKYAIRVGGGRNHRFGLDDAVLIKDNHRLVVGGVAAAVERARASLGHLVKLGIEGDDLDQLAEALAAGVDAVLLDNMAPADLERAVQMTGDRAVIEASGGIDADSIREVAAAGVDLISVGWITHSAPALDLGLDFRVR